MTLPSRTRPIIRSAPVRSGARFLLRSVSVKRRLTNTPFKLEFPARQYLGLLRPGGMNYEPEVRQAFAGFIEPGMTVLDVGANIGLHSLFLAHLVGPDGRVHAFEPDPQSSSVLLKNIARNPKARISPWSLALSAAAGVAELHVDIATARTSSLNANHEAPYDKQTRAGIQVPTIALDGVIDKIGPIHFAKIDVEGAELDVLKGAESTIQQHRPGILVEVMASAADAIRTLLTGWGYEIVDTRTGLPPSLEETCVCIWLCVPTGNT